MSVITLNYIVASEDENKKISDILRYKLKISARLLTKLKLNNKIYVNRTNVFSNYIVKEKDEILVDLDFVEEDFITPENIPLQILYEDDYFLIINKPANMVVHPSAYHQSGTLANAVKYYLNNNKKIHAINRLDRDTSGITVFAKSEYIQEIMSKEKSFNKEYIALANRKI